MRRTSRGGAGGTNAASELALPICDAWASAATICRHLTIIHYCQKVVVNARELLVAEGAL